MRLFILLLVLVSQNIPGVGQPARATRPAQAGACPACSSTYGLHYESPPYVALRFVADGQLLAPAPPFAETTAGTDEQEKGYFGRWSQFQFGQVYLTEADRNEGRGRYPRGIQCIRGRDTMLVYVEPSGAFNSLYDSIPFRPGRYELLEVGCPYQVVSFATYYQEHEGDLARANPFAGCCFAPESISHSDNPDKYVPASPADIFRLLLVHYRYDKTRWKLRPLASGEQLPRYLRRY